MRVTGPLLGIGLCSAIPLLAQLIDCRMPSTGYKVLLDEIVYKGSRPRDAEAGRFMALLDVKLKNDLEVLKMGTRLPLMVVRCPGRRPGEESDFRLALVEALNSQNVLLEVWGEIIPSSRTSADMLIRFAVIPVRFYEPDSEDLAGVYRVRYAAKSSNPDQLLELLNEARELKAFVLMAGGTKAYRDRRYNEAYGCLCEAGQLLGRLEAEGLQAARQALVRYTRRLATETVQRANADTGYSGTLRLLNANNPAQICAGSGR